MDWRSKAGGEKRLKKLVVLGALMVAAATCLAQTQFTTDLLGSHDLGPGGRAPIKGALAPCQFCHAPHSARGTIKPLWAQQLSTATYTLYTSSTMTNVPQQPALGSSSSLCLSCHDGVGAMNVLINNAGSGFGTNPASTGVVQNQFGDFALADPNMGSLNVGGAVVAGDTATSGGGDLQNDHPIGFVYNDTLDAGLKPIAGMDVRLRTRFGVTSNRLECSTCHDPHVTNTGGNMFLVMPNAGSALCLECHNK